MKLKEYTNIHDYIKIKKEEKKQILKGTVICKAKKCNNFLNKNHRNFETQFDKLSKTILNVEYIKRISVYFFPKIYIFKKN